MLFASVSACFADDISSTKRGSDSIPAGSINSTVRASGASKPDPMLNMNAPDPASALSTNNMTSSDPMLSTTQAQPKSAISTVGMAAASSMDPRLCNLVTRHHPAADVAYQPGVGANGKPVAPADVPGSQQMKLPEKFDIPLTINLAKTLKLDTSKPPYNTLGSGTESWLGTLTVDNDKVLFNGQPLSDQQQDNLAVLCLKQN